MYDWFNNDTELDIAFDADQLGTHTYTLSGCVLTDFAIEGLEAGNEGALMINASFAPNLGKKLKVIKIVLVELNIGESRWRDRCGRIGLGGLMGEDGKEIPTIQAKPISSRISSFEIQSRNKETRRPRPHRTFDYA